MTLRQSPSGPIDLSNAVPFAALAGLSGERGSVVAARENLGIYQWVDSQNLAPNSAQVVNAPGGQWQRLSQASQEWCSQAAWIIDPINGSDLAPSVIKSWAEFNARTQPQGTLRQNTTVSILSDMSESINWNGFIGLFNTANLDISSPSTSWTQTGGGTITTFTSLVPSTQQNAIVDDTGGAFTGKEGQRIRITSGASINATAWILKVNSATQIELAGDFQLLETLANILGSVVTPVAGVTYVTETVPRVGSVSMLVQGPGTGTVVVPQFTQLTMRDLAIDKIGQAAGGRESTLSVQNQGGNSQFRMLRCRYKGRGFSTQLGFSVLLGCLFQNDGSLILDNPTLIGGGFLGSAAGGVLLSGGVQFGGNFIARNPFGATAGLVSMFRGSQLILPTNASVGCFDNSTGPGFSMGVGGGSAFMTAVSTHLRGNGNAGFGGVITSGRLVQYGTTKPIVTGTLGDWQIGGATVAYAAIPFFDTAKACGLVTL